MGKLFVKRRKSQVAQVGDMRDRISLYTRAITEPAFGTANFTQKYTLIATVWASVNTTKGPIIFDAVDVNEKKQSTIQFWIRYNSQVTTETIVQFDGNNYEILEPPDQEKRKRFMLLSCALIGDKTLEVSQ